MKRKQKENENKVKYADKYIYGSNYSDKFDYLRKKEKDSSAGYRQMWKHFFKVAGIALCAVLLFSAGYFLMNLIMQANVYTEKATTVAPSEQEPAETDTPSIGQVSLSYRAKVISASSLDGAAMAAAVVDDAVANDLTAVVFDLKRKDGTLAYHSALTNTEVYGAVSSPASDLKGSVDMLLDNNIMPVARIYTFEDPLASSKDTVLAVRTADLSLPWRDKSGKTWLNPYSDEARQYILAIVSEVSELGIPAVILDGMYFSSDNLSNAYFAAGVTSEPSDIVFKTFLNTVRETAGDRVKFFVAAPVTLDGPESLTPQLLEYYTGSKWAEDLIPVVTTALPWAEAVQVLQAAGIQDYVINNE